MRAAIISTAILVVLGCPSRPSLAQAEERWHLLVLPAAYNKVENRFVRISDAPLVKWYHEGEFATYGERHKARATKATVAERMSKDTKDADNWFKAQVWAYEHGRCLSSGKLQ